jgi:hypothetical protein
MPFLLSHRSGVPPAHVTFQLGVYTLIDKSYDDGTVVVIDRNDKPHVFQYGVVGMMLSSAITKLLEDNNEQPSP